MLKPEDTLAAALTGAEYRSQEKVDPKFKINDVVVVKNHQPYGHTRLPGYLRGRKGVIVKDEGVFVFPDTVAHELGDKPQHLYTVEFDPVEVWGSVRGETAATIRVGMFDDYLDMAE